MRSAACELHLQSWSICAAGRSRTFDTSIYDNLRAMCTQRNNKQIAAKTTCPIHAPPSHPPSATDTIAEFLETSIHPGDDGNRLLARPRSFGLSIRLRSAALLVQLRGDGRWPSRDWPRHAARTVHTNRRGDTSRTRRPRATTTSPCNGKRPRHLLP